LCCAVAWGARFTVSATDIHFLSDTDAEIATAKRAWAQSSKHCLVICTRA
jgi:hypothetical protein